MWLYLENESFIFIETIAFALFFFAFQLIMCIRAKSVAIKLLPIYVFTVFAVLLLVMPFVIAAGNTRGNWGLMLATLFNLAELAFIALFIGLAWIAYAIMRTCKKQN